MHLPSGEWTTRPLGGEQTTQTLAALACGSLKQESETTTTQMTPVVTPSSNSKKVRSLNRGSNI